MKYPNKIHQTPEEQLAISTERGADNLDDVKDKLDVSHETLKNVHKAIKDIPEPKEFPTEMAVSLKGVSVVSIKGDRGESPKKEELLALIKPLIPEPIKGEDADNEKILEELTKRIPPPIVGKSGDKGKKGDSGKDGKDGRDGIDKEPETPDTIAEKLNSKVNHIDFKVLKGIPDFILARDMPHSTGGGGGGSIINFRDSTGAQISQYVTDIQFGTGISQSYSSGKITLTAPEVGTVTSVASADGSITVTNPTTTPNLAVVQAPKLTTGRTISITGDIAYTSPAFDGSANITAAGTLATVNSNVGSFTNASITVNGKGLVTAISSGTAPVISVSGTTNRITSSGGATPVIDISANYVGQSSITTLGTITTGVWNGTTIAVANGGTGLTSLTANLIPYATATNVLGTSANLFYNGSSLGVGSGTMVYPTTTGLNLFSSSAGASNGLNATNTSATGFIQMLFAESNSQYGGFFKWNSSSAGNYTGTSLPFANSFEIQSGSSNNYNFVIASSTLIHTAGVAGTNSAIRNDSVGLRIGLNSDIHTANTVKFEVGGNSYFNGNVGIGTAAPATKLSIAQSASYAVPTLGTATGGFSLIDGNPALYGLYGGVAASGNAWLQVMRNDSAVAYNLLLQPSGGNVGIGTITPQTPLSVTGVSGAFNSGTGGGSFVRFTTGTGANSDNQLGFGVVDGSYSWIQATQIGTALRNLVLQPAGGNVGIGTAGPGYKLDVASPFANGVSGTIAKFGGKGSWSSGDYERFQFGFSQIDSIYNSAASAGWDLAFRTGVSDGSGTEKMRIDRNGNVGIGTAGPANLLHTYKVSGENLTTFQAGSNTTSFYTNDIYGSGVYRKTGTPFFIGVSNDGINTTGMVHQLDIDTTGKVGIGTTTPSHNLVVGTDLGAFAISGTSKAIVLGNSADNFYLIEGQDSTHHLQTNWNYNATAANAYAEMVTYGYNNQIRINASNVILQNASNGNVGIGTASPQATLDINGSMRTATAAKSANYTLTTSDSTIYATTGVGGITITLPAASANTIGLYYFVYKVDAGVGLLTIAAAGTDTINGAATKTIANQWNGVLLRGLTATSWLATSFTGL